MLVRPVSTMSDPGGSSNERFTLEFFLNLSVLGAPSVSRHVIGFGPSICSFWEWYGRWSDMFLYLLACMLSILI